VTSIWSFFRQQIGLFAVIIMRNTRTHWVGKHNRTVCQQVLYLLTIVFEVLINYVPILMC